MSIILQDLERKSSFLVPAFEWKDRKFSQTSAAGGALNKYALTQLTWAFQSWKLRSCYWGGPSFIRHARNPKIVSGEMKLQSWQKKRRHFIMNKNQFILLQVVVFHVRVRPRTEIRMQKNRVWQRPCLYRKTLKEVFWLLNSNTNVYFENQQWLNIRKTRLLYPNHKRKRIPEIKWAKMISRISVKTLLLRQNRNIHHLKTKLKMRLGIKIIN